MIGCLIIHGYTGGPYEIGPLKKFLESETDWQINVPVLEGHGKTLELDAASHEVWMDDAEAALIKLKENCEVVYLIGFSMGGMIAAYLAAEHEVDKLVLLSTARKYLSFKYMSYYIADMIRDGFKGKLFENEQYLHYKHKIGNVPLKSNIEFMKLVNETKPYLKEVTSPVFIAQGTKDEMVPSRTAYAIEEEIGSSHREVVFFEQSDHMICLGEDKDILNRMILEFLTDDDKKESASN